MWRRKARFSLFSRSTWKSQVSETFMKPDKTLEPWWHDTFETFRNRKLDRQWKRSELEEGWSQNNKEQKLFDIQISNLREKQTQKWPQISFLSHSKLTFAKSRIIKKIKASSKFIIFLLTISVEGFSWV